MVQDLVGSVVDSQEQTLPVCCLSRRTRSSLCCKYSLTSISWERVQTTGILASVLSVSRSCFMITAIVDQQSASFNHLIRLLNTTKCARCHAINVLNSLYLRLREQHDAAAVLVYAVLHIGEG
jgi:hypothetical protein